MALDALLERLAGLGLVKAGGRQRTDSTHVLGAIRALNRLELAKETLRAALEALAVAAPDWLTGVIEASWQQVYGARIDNLHLPESQAKRHALMVDYGKDGYHLLEQVHGPDAPSWLRELPAIQTLRRVWVQQFYREVTEGRQELRRREKLPEGDGLPPGTDRVPSGTWVVMVTRYSMMSTSQAQSLRAKMRQAAVPLDGQLEQVVHCDHPLETSCWPPSMS